jgi:choline dehydrogenase-like flavoprotein
MIHDDIKTDVLVVGAGPAGVPAAIGAARVGAKVVLIEEDPVVGGAPSDYFVDMFCGGPLTGILSEAQAQMKTLSRRSDALFFLPEVFQQVFRSLLEREGNLRVITGARAVETLMHRERVTGVRVQTKPYTMAEGTFKIESQVTVDATGRGDVAIMAGCTAMYGRDAQSDFGEPHAPATRDTKVQECTWMYISQKIGGGPPLNMMALDHVRLGVLVNGLGWFHSDPDRAIALNPGIYLHWGCRVRCEDTRDSVALAAAQAEARRLMARDHALLRENDYAIYLAPRLGVRESNRILGEHVITENDLRLGTLPEDTIAIGTYGLDLWGEEDSVAVEERGTPAYGIPYPALVPQGVDGLLLAGRIISGTHIGMSAYRVMPIVGSIGQAAGVAAALSVARGQAPRDLDAEVVREVLRSEGQHQQLALEE